MKIYTKILSAIALSLMTTEAVQADVGWSYEQCVNNYGRPVKRLGSVRTSGMSVTGYVFQDGGDNIVVWFNDEYTVVARCKRSAFAKHLGTLSERVKKLLVDETTRKPPKRLGPELHRLRGVFLTTMGADEMQIEASFCEAIRIAKQQKAVSLTKRAEATYTEYRRQKASASGGRGLRLPLW
jgi:hypothetical protein